VWVDRQGRETPINAPPRAYGGLELAPDGTRIAFRIADQETDIWIWELARQTLRRFTFDPAFDGWPTWTPDSRHIIFSSERGGNRSVFWQAADGTGVAERLTERPNQNVNAVTPDGSRVVLSDTGTNDLMLLTLGAERKVQPLLRTPFLERNAEISPDGRWLAYESNDSGRVEVYVRPFADVNSGRWQVSTDGGISPLWARNGQELFYVQPTGALMRVPVDKGTNWVTYSPTTLVEGPYVWQLPAVAGRLYDVSRDGTRFLMLKPADEPDQTTASIVIVQSWIEDLKRLVPIH
jgi:serine/threonine-protein kinase